MLTPRLSAVLTLCGEGERLVDVGCDHAYLACEAVGSGKFSLALCTDVRKGPLERAKESIIKARLSDRISARLCDGLDKVEDFAPDTAVIAGMGGELISAIISRSEYAKGGCTLVLQPMSSAEELRLFLSQNGFSLEKEVLVAEGDKLYTAMRVRYTENGEIYTELEYLTGKTKDSPHYNDLLLRLKRRFLHKLEGMTVAGLDTRAERSILQQIEKELS